MSGYQPRSADVIAAEPTTALPWDEARSRLAGASQYWLATIHPSGHPHVRPVLAVWAGDALYSTASPGSRKAGNVRRDARCTFTTSAEGIDLVLEGELTKVSDDDELRRVGEAYVAKYEWPVTVRDGAFDAPYGAPTAGPPPYEVYRVTPRAAFAFGTTEELAPRSTRWRF